MSNVKDFKSNIISLIFIVLLIMLLSNCGGVAKNRLVHADEKDKFVQVIINDKEIKDKKDGSQFVGVIIESFKQSFEKVSLQTGYDSPKVGELVVIPQSLNLTTTAANKEVVAKSRVKVLTNIDYEIYNSSGTGKVEISTAERIALFPFQLVGGVAAAMVGEAVKKGSGEDAVRGAIDVSLKPWIIAANNRALESMAVAFRNGVMSDPKFKAYAESEKMVNTSPANLKMRLEFTDTNSLFPNNTIDAGEESLLKATITNDGKGTAFDVKLNIDTDYRDINFEKIIAVGDIQPGGSKEVKVNIRAGFDIKDGKAPFSIICSEKRGYDAKKAALYISVAKIEKPKLEIVSTETNDGNSGLAKGNGNNIIESGETIELTVFIKNSGVGSALGVHLVGSNITAGVNWVSGQDSAIVGTIPPGKTVTAKVAFEVPRNFDAKDIRANLNVADVRPVGKAEYQFAQGYSKKSPDLQYAHQIYSKGAKVAAITNGGEYEVEFTISNKGQMAAKNVVVIITSSGGGIGVSRSRMDIGEVKEKGIAQSQRFTLSVPRTYNTNQTTLSIEIAQAYFPSSRTIAQIPVDVKSPNLTYIANLISKNHGNTLEQREQAVLEVQVINNGTLTAEGVKIALASNDEDLQIQGQKEVIVGTIPPGASADIVKFQVSAKPRLRVGAAQLGVNITQNEFLPFSKQYALNILDYEEGATVIDVAGENRPKAAVTASAQAGPKINIGGMESVAAVIEDETYALAFEVADLKTIAKITVLVNGKAVAIKEAANLAIKAAKSKQIVQDIPLDEGENKIVITAYNSDNVPSKKEFTVTRATEEDIDTPKFLGPRNPNAVAVVIGISKFKNDIPAVAYARRDAETVKEYLIKTLGYSEAKIKTFYDEEASVTDLKSYFSVHLRSKIKPGVSDVFVFYSGHGTPDTNTQEPYFVPYDFNASDPVNTGLAANVLYKQIGELGAKSVTIVLDSCFSGKSSDGQQLVKGVSAGLLKSKDPFFGVKNGILLTAATKEQPASWYEKKQHGLFTYYFLQGLQGTADYDKDGVITVEELSAYTRNKVSEQALVLHNREQTPEVKGDGATVVVKYK